METIDLDIEETNELAFKIKVEGAADGQMTARLYCESSEGTLHAFPGQFINEPETVTFRLSKMTKFINEGSYPGWVEVVINNKQFVPVKFNLNFKKPVSIQVENLSRSKLIGSDPAVRMEVPVVVKRTTEPPLPVRSVAKSLKEWYRGGNK